MTEVDNNNQSILLDSLFELCSNKSSGTLFIKTDKFETIQFILEEGEVTDLAFEKLKGMEAVKNLKETTYINVQFIEDYYFPLMAESKIDCSHTLLNQLDLRVA